MDKNLVLDELRIATPCTASWNTMKGGDRVRFCDLCEKHVYNISAMSSSEAEELIRRTEGRACVRLYRRRDGSVLTSDCPVGREEAMQRRLSRLAKVAIAVTSLWAIATTLRATEHWAYSPASDPTEPFRRVKEKVLQILGWGPTSASLRQCEVVGSLADPAPLMGRPVAVPTPPPPAGGSAATR